MPPSQLQTRLYTAAAAIDAHGHAAAPGALLVEFDPGRPRATLPAARVLAFGTPAEVSHHPAAHDAARVDLGQALLIPGLVNAHTHLDLTHIGPQPHDPAQGFVPWVDMVRSRRRTDDAEIAAAVAEGIQHSLRGGTVLVGDVAGSPGGRMTLAPFEALERSPLAGNSYIEFFGIGASMQPRRAGLEQLLTDPRFGQRGLARLGLQPHAPNTVDRRLYRFAAEQAARIGFPISTHLAETREERLFIASAQGPQRELLERFNLWDDSITQELGRGLHPVDHLSPVLGMVPFVLAHVNDCPDSALAMLAGSSVVYCPRASAYFHAERHFGPHRYRDLLAAGVNVCLGTDSAINLPAEQFGRSGISVFDEMRLLYRRDGTDPVVLLDMATRRGHRALDPGSTTTWTAFAPGAGLLGAVAVALDRRVSDAREALGQALSVDHSPRLLWHSRGQFGPV